MFEHDGKQYVMLVAAGSAFGGTAHGDSVWLFGLDGTLGPVGSGGSWESAEMRSEIAPASAPATQSC